MTGAVAAAELEERSFPVLLTAETTAVAMGMAAVRHWNPPASVQIRALPVPPCPNRHAQAKRGPAEALAE